MTVSTWEEHKIPLLEELSAVKTIYNFIEEAVKRFKSCLVVSVDNKCKTVMIATVYLMYKYKWSLHKTFEFLNDRKPDIEMTKGLVKQLQKVESMIQKEMNHDPVLRRMTLRQDWHIGPIEHKFEDRQIVDQDFLRVQKKIIQSPKKEKNDNRFADANEENLNDQAFF